MEPKVTVYDRYRKAIDNINPWDCIPAVTVALLDTAITINSRFKFAICVANVIENGLLLHLRDIKNCQPLISLSRSN